MQTIALTLEQYNSPVYVDDLDIRQYELGHLIDDWDAMYERLRAFAERHGEVPEELCQSLRELIDRMDMDWRALSPGYQAYLAERERDDAWTMRQYAAAHIAAGHEEG